MAAVLFVLLACFSSGWAAEVRTVKSFDGGWSFMQADARGAEEPAFDDRAWLKLDVPHDWSIAGPFAETNATRGSGGFLPAGTGWYRKHFALPPGNSGRRVFLEFDGVMANSDVWINGFHLGHRPYGYVSFSYELTGHLNYGEDNVVAVRCDDSRQPASRFYAGAGIYRHVRLVETSPIYIPQWQLFVSTPQVGKDRAMVHVEATVTNSDSAPRQILLNISLVNAKGKTVATAQTPPQTIAGSGATRFDQDIALANPQLWECERPVLYQAKAEVCEAPPSAATPARSVLDDAAVCFGAREYHFDPVTGFWLNGTHFKLKGVCLHADGGAFGMAVPLSIWESRLAALKSLGVNAIRTAHNPPAPEFLDLCDRMGFLVMDEMFDCWTVGKQGLDGVKLADYHLYFKDWSQTDECDTILRDRNHPSVILYSVGNEIHDTPQGEKAKKILAGLVAAAHKADPTRPITMALFRPNQSHDYEDGLADMLDVIGQNYRENEILAAHEQKPSRAVIGTENRQDRATWMALRDHPPYAGQFLWTGVDYLGESRRWPLVGHGSGLLDRTGALRPVAFERQSWWGDQPMVFMVRRVAPTDAMPMDPGYGGDERYSQVLFADWTPRNPDPHPETVEVYSNCKEVELFLNGKSLGTQEIHADASPRIWNVVYAPGTLKAVARNGRKAAATDTLATAGKAAKIKLIFSDKKIADDWDAVDCVRAEIVDRHGDLVPGAENVVSFQTSGPGVIAAVDNGDNRSHESFQTNERSAFKGECVAYIKANAPGGRIEITASSPGLKSDRIFVKATQRDRSAAGN